MMKSLSALIMLMSISIACYAQNINLLYKYGVKVYVQGTFSPDAESIVQYPSSIGMVGLKLSSTRYVRPTLAFQIRNIKRNYHEFELSDLSIGKTANVTTLLNNANLSVTTAGISTTITSIAVRYEYIHVLMKNKRHKLVPSVGFAGSPYYIRFNVQPYTTAQYPLTNTYAGARLFITPRINYFVTKNIFLDLNVPLCVADMHHFSYDEKNPTVSANMNSSSLTNFNAFPDYFSVRAGLGIKL